MKREDQVCSIEYTVRLMELNVKQNSLFSWFDTDRYGFVLEESNMSFGLDHYLSVKRIGSAFTCSELAEIIFEKNYDNLEQTGYLEITTEMIDRSGGYFYRLTNNLTEHIVDDLNEANCRAKLFIILLENGIIKND